MIKTLQHKMLLMLFHHHHLLLLLLPPPLLLQYTSPHSCPPHTTPLPQTSSATAISSAAVQPPSPLQNLRAIWLVSHSSTPKAEVKQTTQDLHMIPFTTQSSANNR
ncbi:uncharacterized protein MONOS_14616 [Monocercomonoides exilis]|uniref:uncharacterized protein n=1 Tax=Monocercomonoides exilis TaxID=2049356 RepID=UPI00355A8509|nr:hypothetical protein MONOS_14616 [Monocercomonoides exilis]|eukprot:MONOS_14616.1-p1 / transcript=MONOS_14616.1 / gene=MONOS_14616 / organism=Monocercomonoides_exilis_PA203 / gene_product=unspecified product / transcript_product=unspecified product / location=Mono_scaffold01036:348-665(+) / protein_length=106 / sequence_SO=supercontig / SO=protein_coding / is_pseudo=false